MKNVNFILFWKNKPENNPEILKTPDTVELPAPNQIGGRAKADDYSQRIK